MATFMEKLRLGLIVLLGGAGGEQVTAHTPRQKPRLMAHEDKAALITLAVQKNFLRTQNDFYCSQVPKDFAHKDFAQDALEQEAKKLPEVFGLQTGVPEQILGFLADLGFIGYQTCSLLAQHWLIAKACSQAPKDAVRYGFEIIIENAGEAMADIQQDVEKLDKKHRILAHCREFSRNINIFGVRHALFVVEGLDYERPFRLEDVRPGTYKGIAQIDPYWLTPEFEGESITRPDSRHFYEPTFYRTPSGQRIHRSHFVIGLSEEVADVLKPSYLFGGIPLPQKIVERVYAAERTANEAPELALTKRLLAIQGDIESMLEDETRAQERLQTASRFRNNYGFFCYGAEENVVQIDTSLADFDALIMTQYQLVAAIANTPATKLLGTSPKGFNATGEHETRAYDDHIDSIQTNDMTPLIERHHALLQHSDLTGYDVGPDAFTLTHKWKDRPATPAEQAEINSKNATVLGTLADKGFISPDEGRETIKATPVYGVVLGEGGPEDGAASDPFALSPDELASLIGGQGGEHG